MSKTQAKKLKLDKVSFIGEVIESKPLDLEKENTLDLEGEE